MEKKSKLKFKTFEALLTDIESIFKEEHSYTVQFLTEKIEKFSRTVLIESNIQDEEWEKRWKQFEIQNNYFKELQNTDYKKYQKEMKNLVEESRKKIKLALKGIQRRDPIVYAILTECPIVYTALDRISTMAVDAAGNLYINPIFLNTVLAPEETPKIFSASTGETPEKFTDKKLNYVMGVLAHECLHILNGSFARTPKPTGKEPPGFVIPMIWNISTDYIMNETLLRCGYSLPSKVCLPVRVDPSNPEQEDSSSPRSAVIFSSFSKKKFPNGAMGVPCFDGNAPALVYPLDFDVNRGKLHAQSLYKAILDHAIKYPVKNQDSQSQQNNNNKEQKNKGTSQSGQSEQNSDQSNQDQQNQQDQESNQNSQKDSDQNKNNQSNSNPSQNNQSESDPTRNGQFGDSHIYDPIKKPKPVDTGEPQNINETPHESKDLKDAENKRKEKIKRAQKKIESDPNSFSKGEISGELITKNQLEEAAKPSINWVQLLKDAMTFSPVSYINNNIIDIRKTNYFSPVLPGGKRKIVPQGKKMITEKSDVPNISITIDTSGSITKDELLSMIKSIFDLLESFKDKDIRMRIILWCDHVYFDCAFSTVKGEIYFYDFNSNKFISILSDNDIKVIFKNNSQNVSSSVSDISEQESLEGETDLKPFTTKKLKPRDVGNIFLNLINKSFKTGGTQFAPINKHLKKTESEAGALLVKAPWIFKIKKMFVFTDSDIESDLTPEDVPKVQKPPIIVLVNKNYATSDHYRKFTKFGEGVFKIEEYENV